MEIACPNCAKRFRVPAEKLAPAGRKVRCASCGHVWFQAPSAAAVAEPVPAGAGAAPAPAPAAASQGWPDEPRRLEPGYDRPPIFDGPHLGEPRRFDLSGEADYGNPPQRRSPVGAVFGWLLLVLVIAGLVGGGWYYRNQIVANVPELRQVYDLLGVPLEAGHPGVTLSDVTTRLNTVDGDRTMIITGTVVNAGERPRDVPLLVATVTDSAGAVLVEWRFEAGQPVVAPGESLAFETRREGIPRGDLSVRVDFVLP